MPPAGHAGSRALLQRVQLVRSTSPRKCAKDALEAQQACFCAQGRAPEQARRKHTSPWNCGSAAAHGAHRGQTDVRARVLGMHCACGGPDTRLWQLWR